MIVVKEIIMNLLDLILNPLQYSFMVRGLSAAILTGIVCAVVGVYVVIRGMAFFGDALAHSILPGVAVGYLLNKSIDFFHRVAATYHIVDIKLGFKFSTQS